MRLRAALLTAFGLIALAVPASAEPAPPASAPSAPSQKRALPEYDGRASTTTAGDVLMWVPRVVTFPLYAVSEYALRRPFGALITAADRGKWIENLTNLFTFGPTGNIGIVPTALLDFGLRTSVGVYFFWDDFLAKDNELRVHAATGGGDWLRLTVADRVMLDKDSYVKIRGEASTRPDWLFYGIGPRALESTKSHYGADIVEGMASFHLKLGAGSTLDAWAGVRSVHFVPLKPGSNPPSLQIRINRGELDAPPGLAHGFIAARQGLGVALDSRRPRPEPQGGFRATADVEHDFDLHDPGGSHWLKYGASVGGSIDLTGHARVLTLGITTKFADPLGDAEVPFTELAMLGGDQIMYGFLPNRLLGRSAATASLEYRYPIWAILDGTLQATVGNVFGPHLQDFDPRLLRMSFDFGLRTAGDRDHSFNVMLGFGTETFKDGTHPNTIRFMFGGTKGF